MINGDRSQPSGDEDLPIDIVTDAGDLLSLDIDIELPVAGHAHNGDAAGADGAASARPQGSQRAGGGGGDRELQLLSLETLDRASPVMWPERIPGISEFVPNNAESQEPPSWQGPLNTDDLYLIHQLGTLPTSGLVIEVKKLHDLAYQLGVEEAKEMTRGKYLNVFTSKKNR